MSDPKASYLAHQREIDGAIARVLHRGRYILGNEVAAFEQEFADFIGTDYGIGVSSGTDALILALRAADIGLGDQVITVSNTAVATVAAIEAVGAEPVLVDVEPMYFTMNPASVKEAITDKTKAILPVHLYGQPADMLALAEIAAEHDLWLIEDCAQAVGAGVRDVPVGCWGDMACFSFYPTKNLGAIGDGGMVVTGNSQLADKLKSLRQYGWQQRYISEISGYNSRLDELQAAILRVKLRYLKADNQQRQNLALLYSQLLDESVLLPWVRLGNQHAWHLFVVRIPVIRDRVVTALKEADIEVGIHYPLPIHLQPAYKGRIKMAELLTVTEEVATEILSLPLYPELSVDAVTKVATVVRESVTALAEERV